MLRTRSLALAASATIGAAALSTPALANYVRIGSVEINHRGDHETQWNRFGGRMEGLRLIADGHGIHCRSIRVQYGNGHWDKVFSGRLREGRVVDVDLRGRQRRVRRVRFVCGTRHYRNAKIEIAADIGRYTAEWRHSRYWHRLWSRAFGRQHRWSVVGSEHFSGRRDHERSYPRWRGRHVETIALRPYRNDARCRRVRVTFHNGNARNLDIGRRDRLREGRLYRLDLPGRERNVRRIDMVCHGVHHDPVTIELLAR